MADFKRWWMDQIYVPSQLNAWAREIHEWAKKQGFYDRDTPENVSFPSEKILLIAGEVSREIQDALRDGDSRHEAEEVADAVIRLLDYAHWRGFSIGDEIRLKMISNSDRLVLHGRKEF